MEAPVMHGGARVQSGVGLEVAGAGAWAAGRGHEDRRFSIRNGEHGVEIRAVPPTPIKIVTGRPLADDNGVTRAVGNLLGADAARRRRVFPALRAEDAVFS